MTDVVRELGVAANPDREALDQVINGRSAVEFDGPFRIHAEDEVEFLRNELGRDGGAILLVEEQLLGDLDDTLTVIFGGGDHGLNSLGAMSSGRLATSAGWSLKGAMRSNCSRAWAGEKPFRRVRLR